jgi:hypothetical protein
VEVSPAGTERGGLTRSARVSIFFNVVLICLLGTVLAVALIWLAGRLAWKHDLRVDLTGDSRFTIDPMAAAVIRGLREPVHATFVFGIDDEIRQRALDLARRPRDDVLAAYYRPIVLECAARVQVVLREWSKLSEMFTFDSIDADLDPARLAEAAQRRGRTATDLLRNVNHVVLETGRRRRSVPMGRMFRVDWGFVAPDPRAPSRLPVRLGEPTVQSELTDVLRGLAAGDAIKAGFPQGIASAVPPEGREWDGLRDLLSWQGFDPSFFELARGVPEDVALVIILGMGRRLLPDETQALASYERRGGRLLILADPRKPEDFARVLEPYGVRLEPAVIEDEKRMRPGQPDPSLLLSNELTAGNHEIDRPVAGRIGIHVGWTRPLKIDDLRAEGAVRTILLQASPDAKATPVEFREQSGEPSFVASARRAAPRAALAAALARPADGGREARVVVFGSWEVAAPGVMERGTHYGNRDLVLNALNWIADRRTAIGVVERELAASRVELTPGFLASFRWISMAALPGALALAGLVVWLRRRT